MIDFAVEYKQLRPNRANSRNLNETSVMIAYKPNSGTKSIVLKGIEVYTQKATPVGDMKGAVLATGKKKQT